MSESCAGEKQEMCACIHKALVRWLQRLRPIQSPTPLAQSASPRRTRPADLAGDCILGEGGTTRAWGGEERDGVDVWEVDVKGRGWIRGMGGAGGVGRAGLGGGREGGTHVCARRLSKTYLRDQHSTAST